MKHLKTYENHTNKTINLYRKLYSNLFDKIYSYKSKLLNNYVQMFNTEDNIIKIKNTYIIKIYYSGVSDKSVSLEELSKSIKEDYPDIRIEYGSKSFTNDTTCLYVIIPINNDLLDSEEL